MSKICDITNSFKANLGPILSVHYTYSKNQLGMSTPLSPSVTIQYLYSEQVGLGQEVGGVKSKSGCGCWKCFDLIILIDMSWSKFAVFITF